VCHYLAQQKDGLVQFVLEELRLDDRQRPAVYFNESMAAFAVSNSSGRFLKQKKGKICTVKMGYVDTDSIRQN